MEVGEKAEVAVAPSAVESVDDGVLRERLQSIENKSNRRPYRPVSDEVVRRLMDDGLVAGRGRKRGALGGLHLTEEGRSRLYALSREHTTRINREADEADNEQLRRGLLDTVENSGDLKEVSAARAILERRGWAVPEAVAEVAEEPSAEVSIGDVESGFVRTTPRKGTPERTELEAQYEQKKAEIERLLNIEQSFGARGKKTKSSAAMKKYQDEIDRAYAQRQALEQEIRPSRGLSSMRRARMEDLVEEGDAANRLGALMELGEAPQDAFEQVKALVVQEAVAQGATQEEADAIAVSAGGDVSTSPGSYTLADRVGVRLRDVRAAAKADGYRARAVAEGIEEHGDAHLRSRLGEALRYHQFDRADEVIEQVRQKRLANERTEAQGQAANLQEEERADEILDKDWGPDDATAWSKATAGTRQLASWLGELPVEDRLVKGRDVPGLLSAARVSGSGADAALRGMEKAGWIDADRNTTESGKQALERMGDFAQAQKYGLPMSVHQQTKGKIEPQDTTVGARWYVGKVGDRPAYSNGHVLVVGATPVDSARRDEIGPDGVNETVRIATSEVQPVEAIGFDVNKKLVRVWFSDGTAVNGSYYDAMRRLFPTATWWHGDSTKSFVLREGKQVVGLVMPLRNDTGPAGIRRLLRSAEAPSSRESETPTKGEAAAASRTSSTRDRPSGAAQAYAPGADASSYDMFIDFEEKPGSAAGSTCKQHAQGQRGAFSLRGLAMPELYKLAKAIMGHPPRIKRLPKSWGLFKSHPGSQWMEILINPKSAKDENALAQVLGHEIGHLTDFFDSLTMARGNILGRVASLRKHMGHYIAGKPGGPGPLTETERNRLRREAEKLLTADAEIVIDEEIEREIQLQPDDILAIWNSTEANIRERNPKLYDFIAGLSTAEKKSIVKAALKGQVASALQRFAGIVREKTGRVLRQKIRSTPDLATIQKKYAELIAEEIRKRQLLSRDIITDELVKLTEWWSPYDKATVPPGYIKYRESSKELYAEALSVFLNTPGELEQRAPMFYRGFMEYLERKPHVLDEYMRLQEMLYSGFEALGEARLQDISSMFAKGEEKLRMLVQQRAASRGSVKERLSQLLSQYVLARTAPGEAKQQQLDKASISVPDAENARYMLDEMYMSENPFHVLLERTQREIIEPLLESGIEIDDFGSYLFLRRVVNGRGEIANPIGYTPSSSDETLVALRRRLGTAGYARLEEAAQSWHREIVWPLTERAVKSGVYPKASLAELEKNKDNYATFSVFHHLDADKIGARLWAQVGTFGEVLNPFTATMMKLQTLTRFIELNNTKRSFVKFLDTNFPLDLEHVDIPYGAHEPKGRPPAGREFVTYLEDGQLRAVAMPQNMAKMFELHDVGGLAKYAAMLQSAAYRVFHPLFVTYNPGFQVANIPRDFGRTYANLAAIGSANYKRMLVQLKTAGVNPDEAQRLAKKQKITLGQVMAAYWAALGPSYRRAKGISDQLIQQMYEDKSLGIPFVSITEGMDKATKYERMLAAYGLVGREGRNKATKAWGAFLAAGEMSGVLQETASKVAAYQLLGAKGVTGEKRGFIVRNYTGTPNIYRRGLATNVTNSMLFYSKVRWNGQRADADLAFNPETAAAWWWRGMVWVLLPKMMMWTARRGLLAGAGYGAFKGLQELFELMPDYFLQSYDVIPLGTIGDEDKEKGVFLTIPQPDTWRFMGSVVWQMLQLGETATGVRSGTVERSMRDLLREFHGELIPGWNPLINLATVAGQYALGINPYERFFGEPLIPQREWKAGGWRSGQKLAQYFFDQTGVVGALASTAHGIARAHGAVFSDDDITTTEAWARFPGVSRLIRITDRGLDETLWAETEADEQEQAVFQLDLPKQVRRLNVKRFLFNKKVLREKLTPEQLDEKDRLNAWYSNAYEPLSAAMHSWQELGNDAEFNRLKGWLEESTEGTMFDSGDYRDLYKKFGVGAKYEQHQARLQEVVADPRKAEIADPDEFQRLVAEVYSRVYAGDRSVARSLREMTKPFGGLGGYKRRLHLKPAPTKADPRRTALEMFYAQIDRRTGD